MANPNLESREALINEVLDGPDQETIKLVMKMTDNEFAQFISDNLPSPEIYLREDILPIDQVRDELPTGVGTEAFDGAKYALPIDLYGEKLYLPVINIADSPNDEPKYIAYLNPKRPDIENLGAKVISLLISSITDIGMMATFTSSKSEPMINRGMEIARESLPETVEQFTFIGSKDEGDVKDQIGDDGFLIKYESILHKEKYMGLTRIKAREILDIFKAGKKLILTDDVISRGGTTDAARALVREAMIALGYDQEITDEQMPIVVLARENTEDHADDEIDNLRYGMFIPVVVGGLD